jgi:hypothetical protein
MSRWFTICLAVLLAILPSSCGRKAPWYAPTRVALGNLVVLSTPAGADILLDGIATGRVTPDTLGELPAGGHIVRVRREGWVAAPESLSVQVVARETARAEFMLTPGAGTPTPLVLLEAFSNVSCMPCIQMAATLRALLADPAFGPDRVALIEYAANWPKPTDPHYQAAPAQNTARMMFYQDYLAVGIPTLVVDGALAGLSGQPPAIDGLRALVASRLGGNPGFTIAVTAFPGDPTTITASATLRASSAVGRAGAVLDFALVQDPLIYDSPPGDNGETVFHGIMRDFVSAVGPIFPLAAHDSVERTVTLNRQSAWPLADLHVIAFVQDPQTREVLQAGQSGIATTPTRAARDSRSMNATRSPRSPHTRRGKP